MNDDKLEFPIIYTENTDFNDKGDLINNSLLSTGKPVIIMIQSKNCGWCTQAKPEYIKSANKYNKIIFSVIDVEQNPDAAKKVSERSPNYRGLPHYMCYKNGKLVSDEINGREEKDLKNFAS